jgi:hypothetical protein
MDYCIGRVGMDSEELVVACKKSSSVNHVKVKRIPSNT